MAKKHKHEEHVNHERWLVSFADMMTLLFALFVVLYAMGQADLTKAEALKNSVQWAFHIAGSGKTKDTGVFDQQKGGGETLAPAPLLNAQQGQMLEFMREMAPEYEEIAGQSLEVVQTDDTVAMTAPLTAFFPRDQVGPVPQAMQTWLEKVVVGSLSFSSDIRVHIDTPDLVIARSLAGRPVTSLDLCIERLKTLERVIKQSPQVRDHLVSPSWRTMPEDPRRPVGDWEQAGRVRITFSNPAVGKG